MSVFSGTVSAVAAVGVALTACAAAETSGVSAVTAARVVGLYTCGRCNGSVRRDAGGRRVGKDVNAGVITGGAFIGGSGIASSSSSGTGSTSRGAFCDADDMIRTRA